MFGLPAQNNTICWAVCQSGFQVNVGHSGSNVSIGFEALLAWRIKTNRFNLTRFFIPVVFNLGVVCNFSGIARTSDKHFSNYFEQLDLKCLWRQFLTRHKENLNSWFNNTFLLNHSSNVVSNILCGLEQVLLR